MRDESGWRLTQGPSGVFQFRHLFFDIESLEIPQVLIGIQQLGRKIRRDAVKDKWNLKRISYRDKDREVLTGDERIARG